jgi:hypothetical protein
MSDAVARLLLELLRLSESERTEVASALRRSLGAPATALTHQKRHSILDVPTVSFGETLRPLGTRGEWYDEMLEHRFPSGDQQ